MLKLLAFDLDDTLYPETKYIRAGFRAVSSYMRRHYQIDGKKFYRELTKTKKEEHSGKVFDNVLKKYKLDRKDIIEELVKIYRAAPLQIKLFSGVEVTLIKLKKSYILSLVTDGRSAVQSNKFNYLKLNKYFNSIIFTLDLGDKYAKPSALAFKKMLNDYKIKAKEAIYIGNNPDKDFVGAKKIGMKTVRINQGIFRGRITNKSTESDFTIRSIRELPSLVSRI